MHRFTELVRRSTEFTLGRLSEANERTLEALQTSGATTLVKALQMIQLQKAIFAIGMFSIFEAQLQDSLGCADGFERARDILNDAGESELRDRFGPIPTAARRMIQLRELNLRALSWRVENVHLENGYAVFRYRDAKRIRMLSHLHKGHLRVVDAHDAYWPLETDETDGAAVLDELLETFSAAQPPAPE